MKTRFKVTPAVYLVLRNNDQILLSRRYNTGYRDGYYSLVAGHLDGGETMRAALSREAQEEAGITIDPTDLRLVHTMHIKSEEPGNNDGEYVTFYFETSNFRGEPAVMEPNKCDQMAWYTFDALPKPMIDHVQATLININKGIDYSEFGW